MRSRQMESSMGIDDQFFSEEINIISIDDIPCELSFVNENLVDDFKIKEINVSMLFRQYQNKSVTTNIKFGERIKFREVIKRAIKESWSSVKKWWLTELANDQTLDENLGFVILECLKSLPTAKIKNEPSETTLITNYLDHVMKGMLHDPNKYIVEWPNTGLDESKARKSGRSKQPDFVVSVIHQLQTSGVIFVGEVSPPSEKNNVYKNCNDLIRIGVFMKDCLDSAIDLGADIKMLGFQCVDYTVDFYMMDIVQGTYIMIHIGQISVPASVKEMLHFVDEIEILLKIREIFCKSFDSLYAKLCNPNDPSLLSTKASFKHDTWNTQIYEIVIEYVHSVWKI
ncbi:hypothetical protein RhiirA5_276949 [Rhizophagus irregularis]|uniref:Uncharacterized protein n=1 Tax=Rhizophagus irregularis TaxID=588596 RepID=A0A2N0PBI3_9GLOM|nr:hypothetical protein RhiirA5_276949 [Rhizophagus irregularis]